MMQVGQKESLEARNFFSPVDEIVQLRSVLFNHQVAQTYYRPKKVLGKVNLIMCIVRTNSESPPEIVVEKIKFLQNNSTILSLTSKKVE